MDEFLESVNLESRQVIICGDMNLNLSKDNLLNIIYVNRVTENGFSVSSPKSTGIYQASASCTDHESVFVEILENQNFRDHNRQQAHRKVIT